MRVYVLKAKFTGLYEWGPGWLSSGIKDAWYDFFRSVDRIIRPSFWTYLEKNVFTQTQYLVGTGGSIFLHPMDVCYVGHSCMVSKRLNERGVFEETAPEIDELKEILTGAANACGGIVEFSDVAFTEVNEPTYVKGKSSEGAKLP